MNAVVSADSSASGLHFAENIHPVIYVLITNRVATYYEIKYKYSIDEVLDLYEITMVNLYNRYMLIENSKS